MVLPEDRSIVEQPSSSSTWRAEAMRFVMRFAATEILTYEQGP